MRALYLPMYDKPKLIENSSTYNWAVSFFRVLLENEDFFLYFGVPDTMEELPEFFDHPRVEPIPMIADRWQYHEMGNPDINVLEMFRQTTGKYVVDVIFNDKVLANSMVTAAVNDTYKKAPQIMTVCPIQYSLSSKLIPLPPAFFQSQAMGLVSADFTLWSVDNQFERTMVENRKYLSPSAIKKISEGARRGLYAYDYDRLNAVYERVEKSTDIIQMNYANGITSSYKIEDIFDIFDFLFCVGKPVNIVATLPDDDFPSHLMFLEQKYKYFEMYKGLNQDDFYEKAAECHVGMYLGMDGEMSDSIMEQTLLGQVIVYKKAKHNRDWYYEGYPFVGKDLTEVKVHLKYVIENYWKEDVQEVLKKQRRYVKDKFDGRKKADAFYLTIEAERNLRIANFEAIESLQHAITELVKDRKEIEWEELVKIVREGTENSLDMRKAHGRIRISKMFVHWTLLKLGFKDDGQKTMPRYVK